MIEYQPMGSAQSIPSSKVGDGEIQVTPGEHLWVVIAGWRVDPVAFKEGDNVLLDTENLVCITGPGCYACEQEWDKSIASKPCPGESRLGFG